MKKDVFRYLFFICVIILFVSFVHSAQYHSANKICTVIQGVPRTLQESIGSNLLINFPRLVDDCSAPDFGHDTSQIWVSIDGVEMTLEAAFGGDIKGLCGSSDTVTYIGNVNPGHQASEINITVDNNEISLQEAIDSGYFCSEYSWYTTDFSECSEDCGGGTQSREVSCKRSDGLTVLDSYCVEDKPALVQECNTHDCCVANMGEPCGEAVCINSGTINCAGQCSGTSYKDYGTYCGKCSTCNSVGVCNVLISDDNACNSVDCDYLDDYHITGSQGVLTTSYCYLTNYADINTNRCEGLNDCKEGDDCSNPTEDYQSGTTAGICDYISGCSGTTAGSIGYYSTSYSCGTCSVCNGAGSCSSVPADDSSCGTISCDDWHHITGTQGAMSTSYCYDSPDITTNRCEGLDDCKDANSADCGEGNDTLELTAGTCKYILGCSGITDGSIGYYDTSTACSSTQDCDGNNYYEESGTDSPTSTNYCVYNDYADTTRKCDGSGNCAALDCGSPVASTTATAGICKYISGCSGTTPGTVSNYGTSVVCSDTQDCDYLDEYVKMEEDSPTSTNYCVQYDYDDVKRKCDGNGNCAALDCGDGDPTITVTATYCKYVVGCSGTTPGSLGYYGTSTACSSVKDCDNLDEYYIEGTQSAYTTSYCKYDNYTDTTRKCDGNGNCATLDCGSPSTLTNATAGYCKYISGCSGTTPGTVSNYDYGTPCPSGTCDGSGNCIQQGVWYVTFFGSGSGYPECANFGVWAGQPCSPVGYSVRCLINYGGGYGAIQDASCVAS